jgi:hypothetical protein
LPLEIVPSDTLQPHLVGEQNKGKRSQGDPEDPSGGDQNSLRQAEQIAGLSDVDHQELIWAIRRRRSHQKAQGPSEGLGPAGLGLGHQKARTHV